MEFALRTVVIAIICIVVALVVISILISQATGGNSLLDAILEFLLGEMPPPPLTE